MKTLALMLALSLLAGCDDEPAPTEIEIGDLECVERWDTVYTAAGEPSGQLVFVPCGGS